MDAPQSQLIALLKANHWNARPPAGEEKIAALKKAFGTSLPADFESLLRFSDGGSLYGFQTPFIVFPVEEIIALYREFDYYREVPGFMIWGADGGGIMYAYDLRDAAFSVCCFYNDDPGYEKLIYKSGGITETVQDIVNGKKLSGAPFIR